MARRQVRGSRSSRWRAVGGGHPPSMVTTVPSGRERATPRPCPSLCLCPRLILKQIKGNRRGREKGRQQQRAAAGRSTQRPARERATRGGAAWWRRVAGVDWHGRSTPVTRPRKGSCGSFFVPRLRLWGRWETERIRENGKKKKRNGK
ncbi:hypothetical protein PVAP13_4KG281210 [Panicum virgatum]|uniref:Uncharacterized protein n=1 Tax=Panicum virgatum TaxID=38727 RepID=A0A8T0TNJ4_PANVG|nr:hypothetical protein PVAP13_4KG281210 [Panicum virgatum]